MTKSLFIVEKSMGATERSVQLETVFWRHGLVVIVFEGETTNDRNEIF